MTKPNTIIAQLVLNFTFLSLPKQGNHIHSFRTSGILYHSHREGSLSYS